MINKEDKYKNVIEELKQLTITYDKFKIDNCLAKLKHNVKNIYILVIIEKDDFILSWSFNIEDKSAWLALNNIKGKRLNIVYHNKPNYYPFINDIQVENEDFNKFLTIFDKLN